MQRIKGERSDPSAVPPSPSAAGKQRGQGGVSQYHPKVLAHSIENGIHIEESRQLLSYSLIHPAITTTNARSSPWWLTHLEDRCSYSIYQHQMRLQQQVTMDPSKTPLQDLTTNISRHTRWVIIRVLVT